MLIELAHRPRFPPLAPVHRLHGHGTKPGAPEPAQTATGPPRPRPRRDHPATRSRLGSARRGSPQRVARTVTRNPVRVPVAVLHANDRVVTIPGGLCVAEEVHTSERYLPGQRVRPAARQAERVNRRGLAQFRTGPPSTPDLSASPVRSLTPPAAQREPLPSLRLSRHPAGGSGSTQHLRCRARTRHVHRRPGTPEVPRSPSARTARP